MACTQRLQGVRRLKEKRDYYEVLGISRDADASQIKKAYRKLAKKYHPDSNEGDSRAAERFKEATEAYTILSDPEKKKIYDQYGSSAFDGVGGFRADTQRTHGFGGSAGGFSGFSGYSDGFSGHFQDGNGGYRSWHFEGGEDDDLFGDIFGSMFHGRGRENTKSRGQDITAQIEIPFDAAAFGGEQAVTLTAPDGSRKTFQVQIPAGIDEGQTIRLRGKGAPGTKGAEAGDLLLKVSLGSRPGFERRGKDIYTTAAIPFTTAVFGGEARVSTLYGDVLCKILPGTQSGSRIRLSGKGIVSSGVSSVRGDQYVSIQIAVLENLNREAAQKLHEFEAACRTGNGRGAA